MPRVDARSARRFGLSRALLRDLLRDPKLGALTLVPERRVVPCPSAHLAVRGCAGAASNSGDATRVASKSQICSTCGTPPVRQLGSSRYRPASSRPAARPPIVRASTFVLWARIMAELRRHSASLTTDQGNRPSFVGALLSEVGVWTARSCAPSLPTFTVPRGRSRRRETSRKYGLSKLGNLLVPRRITPVAAAPPSGGNVILDVPTHNGPQSQCNFKLS